MKSKNILAETKSKSLKDVKKEINDVLSKLENSDMDLESSTADYKRLIQLNNQMEELFRKRSKEIFSINKKDINDKK
jgi:exonuclease VII small subunit|tara:strand:- start:276 stop:506 length:231 start_codon:yes stop_codon:yes gene_type:complete